MSTPGHVLGAEKVGIDFVVGPVRDDIGVEYAGDKAT